MTNVMTVTVTVLLKIKHIGFRLILSNQKFIQKHVLKFVGAAQTVCVYILEAANAVICVAKEHCQLLNKKLFI